MSKELSCMATMLFAWGNPRPLCLDTQINLAYGEGRSRGWKNSKRKVQSVMQGGGTHFVLPANDPLQKLQLINVKTHYSSVVPSSMDLTCFMCTLCMVMDIHANCTLTFKWLSRLFLIYSYNFVHPMILCVIFSLWPNTLIWSFQF